MPIQNLEQKRAFNALDKAPDCRKRKDDGDCLSGFPSLIVNNGLLACLAYSIEKSADKKTGVIDLKKQWINISNAIAFHLRQMGIVQLAGGQTEAEALRDYLAGRSRDAQNQFVIVDSFTLRRCTDEALAFLSYLKRFAKSAAATP